MRLEGFVLWETLGSDFYILITSRLTYLFYSISREGFLHPSPFPVWELFERKDRLTSL